MDAGGVKPITDRLSEAADSTTQPERSKAIAEANFLLMTNNVQPASAEVKAIQENLEESGKLGKLTILEFADRSSDRATSQGTGYSRDELARLAGNQDVTGILADRLSNDFEIIDGVGAEGMKDNRLSQAEIISWADSSTASAEPDTSEDTDFYGSMPDIGPIENHESDASFMPPGAEREPPEIARISDLNKKYLTESLEQAATADGADNIQRYRTQANTVMQTLNIDPAGSEAEDVLDSLARSDALRPLIDREFGAQSVIKPESGFYQRTDLEAIASDSSEEPVRRMLAGALERSFTSVDEQAGSAPDARLTPEEVSNWAKSRQEQEIENSADQSNRVAPSSNQRTPPIDDLSRQDKPAEEAEQSEGQKAKAESWSGREVEVDEHGNGHYKVEKGDTVWWVAEDVLKHRLGRQPDNQEINELTKQISEVSGLTRNGRNPDLIYPDEVLIIPPGETGEQGETGEPDERRRPESNVSEPEAREASQPGSENEIEQQDAIDAIKELHANNYELLIKTVALSRQLDHPETSPDTISRAVSLVLELPSAYPKDPANPEGEKTSLSQELHTLNGGSDEYSKETLERIARDSSNGLPDEQRLRVEFLADNFDLYSRDPVLDKQDIADFLSIKKSHLDAITRSENNSLTEKQRQSLRFFAEHFRTISPDNELLEPEDLRRLIELVR
ncbi:MAG: hypothetical protein IPM23_06590 [Candidatus Melainabacteria bacterium]|nr:hypothetical protein [Candidatus Melainabacteria bacterium]